MAKNRRDWDSIIDKLNNKGKPIRIKMGSPDLLRSQEFG